MAKLSEAQARSLQELRRGYHLVWDWDCNTVRYGQPNQLFAKVRWNVFMALRDRRWIRRVGGPDSLSLWEVTAMGLAALWAYEQQFARRRPRKSGKGKTNAKVD